MLKPKLDQKRRYVLYLSKQQYKRWKKLHEKAAEKGLRLVLSEELNSAFDSALNRAEKELSKID